MSEKLGAGIDIGATHMKFGLVDARGDIKFRDRATTPRQSSATKIFEKVLRCGEQLLIEADEQNYSVDFVGVGSPGSVNMQTGVIQGTCPNLPGWVGFHLRDRLAERLNLPVVVDNDANCAALAEYRFGAGKGYRNVVCMTIGTGIGGGIIIDGKLYRGGNFSAGEIGHMNVDGNGNSGGENILESLVSSRAILGRLRERLTGNISPIFQSIIGNDPNRVTMRRVFTAFKRGDKLAVRIIIETARTLGTALVGIVNVLNPDLLVLGGGVVEGGYDFVDIVRETVMEKALPIATEDLGVVPAKLGNAAGFIGAAFLHENRQKD